MKKTIKEKKPSPALLRALRIIRDDKPRNAAAFALLMWPDALMHRTHSRGGRGTQTGKAGWLCGGSYLGRLKKSGWIIVIKSWERHHLEGVAYLTAAGDELMREHDENK